MKICSLLFLSLIHISGLYAQFSEHPKLVTSSRDDFYGQAKIVDIDNDGFKDIMAFENIDLKIFKNGGNLFKSQDRKKTYWSNSQTSVHPFDFADLNSDNLPELIYYSSEYSGINKGLFLKNNLGNGNFGPDISLNIPINASTVVDLKLFDLNNDSYTDIVFSTGSTITIYYGTTNFGIFQNAVSVFSDFNAYIQQMEVIDLNNDNNLDIVFTYCDNAYTNFSINILKKTGNSFLNSNLISLQNNPISHLHCADISNDGKTDLIFQLDATHEITVATNNGNLNFTPNYYLQSANYLSFDVADINGDNFKDIVLGKDNQLNYFPNNQGSFSFAVLPVSGNIVEETKIFCEDFNNDGKNDFLFIKDNGNSYIKLIINENSSFGYTTAVSKSINDTDITSLDFDHNGTKDLILPNCWISNNTNGNFGTCNFFNNASGDFMTYSAIGDLDQDGDYDVAGIVNDQLFIFTNQGNNYDFTPVLIESASCGMVDLQDINGDGKLDLFYVIINYPNPTSPVVYRLNQTNSWSNAVVITNAISPLIWNYKKIQFTDLNADSKPDFVIPENFSLRFFTNNGSGGFSESIKQVSGVELFVKDYKYIISDFNKDGAQDIVMTIYGTDYKYHLSILLNDGNLNFSIQNISDPLDAIIPCFDLIDYDGDYDLDLFYIKDYTDNRYYENHLNVFDFNSYESVTGYGPAALVTLHSADLLGNTSKDVAYTRDKIVIIRENLTTPYILNTNGLIYPNPSSDLISFGVAFDQLQTYTIQVFSTMGTPELSSSIYNENNYLNISSLSLGLHFVKITNNATGEVVQTNFIKI